MRGKGPIRDVVVELRWQIEKGLQTQAFYLSCQPTSTCAVRKAFEENPLLQGGQPLLMSESPIDWAFPVHQDLASLRTGIGSFNRTCPQRTLQGLACIFAYTRCRAPSQGSAASAGNPDRPVRTPHLLHFGPHKPFSAPKSADCRPAWKVREYSRLRQKKAEARRYPGHRQAPRALAH